MMTEKEAWLWIAEHIEPKRGICYYITKLFDDLIDNDNRFAGLISVETYDAMIAKIDTERERQGLDGLFLKPSPHDPDGLAYRQELCLKFAAEID